jgi:pyrroline-5-carboxylate reductase
MAEDWTIGFIGAGVMAEVMIAGLLDEGVLGPDRILASNRRPDRAAELEARYGIVTTTDNVEVAGKADVVVLCVKPQTLAGVLRELHGTVNPSATVLSIIAGARTSVLQAGLGHDRVARCMPNLPCRIRQGMSVWAAPDSTDPARIESILGVMGEAIRVSDESHIDRATAVNGTGPAIVAQFVKAMLEAAAYIGESRSIASETVLATLVGTAQMIRSSDAHVADLIDEVTSPGGTTSRALQVLKQGRFSAVLTEAVDAAYQRTLELGEALETQIAED